MGLWFVAPHSLNANHSNYLLACAFDGHCQSLHSVYSSALLCFFLFFYYLLFVHNLKTFWSVQGWKTQIDEPWKITFYKAKKCSDQEDISIQPSYSLTILWLQNIVIVYKINVQPPLFSFRAGNMRTKCVYITCCIQ